MATTTDRASALLLAALAAPATAQEPPRFELAELRAIALARHPTVESAAAAVAAAEGLRRDAAAWPGLEVRFGLGRARGDDTGTETAIELAQPLELPGLRRWRRRAAELGVRRAELDRRAVESVIDAAVTRLWVEAVLAERALAIQRDDAALARRLMELVAHRVELGEAVPVDALRARSEWFGRRREVVRAERSLAASLAALDTLCAHALGPEFTVAGELPADGAPLVFAELVEHLHAHNPALAEARAAVEQAEAKWRLERKRALPSFAVAAEREEELDKTATGIGVELSLPPWTRRRGAIAAARSEIDRAVADRRALALELEAALHRAAADYATARAEVDLQRGGWSDTARRALEIAEFSFTHGEASLLDRLDAQRAHLAARLAEVEARARLALSRAEVERLIAAPLPAREDDRDQP